MLKTFLRVPTATLVAVAFAFTAIAPAHADTAEALSSSVVPGANAGIKAAMTKPKTVTVAQVPPVTQQPIGGSAATGLPVGFTYFADFSVAYPFGNVGTTGKAWLPGGVDASAGYGFNATTRLVASYYELQHYPVGFNSGTVPLYLQGYATPIGSVNLGTSQPQINVTTKDRFTLLMLEKLINLGNVKGHDIPIVITPTYVARTSIIAASPTGDDRVGFEPGAPNGFALTNIYTRTAQYYSVAFTLPFLKTPKMFGTVTAAPTWLVHRAGLNIDNHVQLYQIAYLEYTPTDSLKFFIEPQASRDYLPTDPYAEHNFAYFLGASQRVGKQGFVQLVLNSGGPSNYSPYGVSALTCQTLPCSTSAVYPTVGGLKATQIQVQFGIGSPTVLPF
jgi:hypothetical protein